MAEPPRGRKLRVTLRRIQILDNKEPFFDRFGEIRLRARVSTEDYDGSAAVTELPETGVYRISDHPGKNIVTLNEPIFEGWVASHLEVELTATEVDRLSKDDPFRPYRRVHSGDASCMIGDFGPSDEGVDPEDVGDWRVWYEIDEV